MYCENCGKNPATTFIKKVVNGIGVEKKLCADCAAEYGYKSFGGNSFANILSSMLENGIYDEYSVKEIKKCENCGSTFKDISRTGKVGCYKCYDTFSAELTPFLKRVHGNVKHIGKIPNLSPLSVPNEKDKIAALRQQLNLLIKNEEFEKAAEVRDQIKALEGRENGNE